MGRGTNVSVKVIDKTGSKYLLLRWKDPNTGKWRQKSSGTNKRREAERLAVALEMELDAGFHYDQLQWFDFCKTYEEEHVQFLAKGSRDSWKSTTAWIYKLMNFNYVQDIDTPWIRRFANQLRNRGKSEATIQTYLARLRAALTWARDMNIIAEVPRFGVRTGTKASKSMRSRPITAEEFDRIVDAVPKIRNRDVAEYQRFLRGLWESGFRVSELMQLSWSPESNWSMDPHSKPPTVRILAAGQKNGCDCIQPITPQFWQLCLATENTQGKVFPLPTDKEKTVIREIARFGRRAGVITDPSKRKYATSHDIGRRAFASRMGSKLTIAELTRWMRHASPTTTMSYYHAPAASQLAEKVWDKGDTLGDTADHRSGPHSDQWT